MSYPKSYEYQDWLYTYDPPPIPDRRYDWQAWHQDYDGPEDCRILTAATESDILREIREFKKDLPQ